MISRRPGLSIDTIGRGIVWSDCLPAVPLLVSSSQTSPAALQNPAVGAFFRVTGDRAHRMGADRMTYIVTSLYHGGAVKRRERLSLDSAHRLAAWEVDQEGAHTARIVTGAGAAIGTYAWRSGLTYADGEG